MYANLVLCRNYLESKSFIKRKKNRVLESMLIFVFLVYFKNMFHLKKY
jgi:hypothetical protein